jgi:hypothetical protein
MSQIGGSIESIEVKGRNFSVAADADGSRKLGGDENEVQANGDGTVRVIATKTPWMLGGLTVGVDNSRGDQEFLQEIVDAHELVAVSITFADSSVYQGRGTITGELNYSSQNATCELSLAGEGKLTRQ